MNRLIVNNEMINNLELNLLVEI